MFILICIGLSLSLDFWSQRALHRQVSLWFHNDILQVDCILLQEFDLISVLHNCVSVAFNSFVNVLFCKLRLFLYFHNCLVNFRYQCRAFKDLLLDIIGIWLFSQSFLYFRQFRFESFHVDVSKLFHDFLLVVLNSVEVFCHLLELLLVFNTHFASLCLQSWHFSR